MKRDPDLIREILMEIEEGDGQMYTDDDDGRKKVEHVILLAEAGYVKGKPFSGGCVAQKLTWEGHEFLDTVRSDTVWGKTKERVSSTVGSTSLEVLKSVAEGITKGLLFPGG